MKNIPLFKVFLPPREIMMRNLGDVLYGGCITEGEVVYDFERSFGEFIGCPHVLSFYSGTAALHTALVLAGVGPGDEVVSTAMTAEPTNMAIRHAGAQVVWADVDPDNGNLTAETISAALTPRTRAIMLVHYGGIPAPLETITACAARNGCAVIEDAAHALGARYGGRLIGSHSDFTVFSFQAIKHMTTVDGGMLACRDSSLLPRGRKFRWFGIDRMADRLAVDVDMVGYKYHMNNVNAAIGLLQLSHIGPVIRRHIENGEYFNTHLKGIPGVSLCRGDAAAQPSYWFYTVLVEKSADFSRALAERGIVSSKAHKRNDLHSVFASSRAHLPGLDAFFSRMVHIPCGWWVTDEDRAYIVDCIKKGW